MRLVRPNPQGTLGAQCQPDQAASARATAGVLLAALVPAAGLAAVTPSAVGAARTPSADASAVVAAAALALAWVVVARLTVAATAVVLAHVPGAVGATARRVAVVASPVLLRSLVRVAVGAFVAVAPAAVSTAALADAAPAPVGASGAGVRVLPAAELPVLDRVVPATAPDPSQPTAPTQPARTTAAAARPHTIVVRSGDTLWDIVDRSLANPHDDADVARAWPRWFAANRSVIGADPALIRPGELLTPPPP